MLEKDPGAEPAEDLAVLRGVLAALTGDADRARKLLRAVLEKNKDHDVAEQVLQAIGN